MRQLPKSNQIKYQLSAAKYLSGRFGPETLNFQEFVKIFRCFVVYIDIDLGAYKLSAPKTGTPVLISLKFRAVIRNFRISEQFSNAVECRINFFWSLIDIN